MFPTFNRPARRDAHPTRTQVPPGLWLSPSPKARRQRRAFFLASSSSGVERGRSRKRGGPSAHPVRQVRGWWYLPLSPWKFCTAACSSLHSRQKPKTKTRKMTKSPTKDQILAALRGVKSPDLTDNIVSLGLVSEVVIQNGRVYFAISVDPAGAGEVEELRKAAATVVEGLPGVESATVALTADREPGSARPTPVRGAAPGMALGCRDRRRKAGSLVRGRPRGTSQARRCPGRSPHHRRCLWQGRRGQIDHGGQSCLALKDRDLEGRHSRCRHLWPSMPRLLGLSGQPQQLAGNKLDPMRQYGLKVMSMGFLVDEDTPMTWRGPMVISALSQMLKDVAWVSWMCWWSTCPGYWRRAAHHGPASSAGRRGDRVHTAGPCADRCA